MEEQIRETTVDVTLQTSFGSGENLELEETVVAGIFSSEQICNRDTPTSPPPSTNTNKTREQCNMAYYIAAFSVKEV